MKVFCVHYLFLKNGELVEMLPRTVEKLEDAGLLVTVEGKPEGELIQMNWEPQEDGITWKGSTELSDTIMAMAHKVEGIPAQERNECELLDEVKP